MLRRVPRPLLALGAFLIALLTSALVAEERGTALGFVAGVFFVGTYVHAALRWDELVAWGKRHPVLDRATAAPLFFFATAAMTSLPLWACALVGVLAAGALYAWDAHRRREAAA